MDFDVGPGLDGGWAVLARVGLRDLDVRLELGLQESARSAVVAGLGITFISRSAVSMRPHTTEGTGTGCAFSNVLMPR